MVLLGARKGMGSLAQAPFSGLSWIFSAVPALSRASLPQVPLGVVFKIFNNCKKWEFNALGRHQSGQISDNQSS